MVWCKNIFLNVKMRTLRGCRVSLAPSEFTLPGISGQPQLNLLGKPVVYKGLKGQLDTHIVTVFIAIEVM